MKVREVIWLPEIEDKLWEKHRLTVAEAEEMLFGEPHIRLVERGHQHDEDLYAAYGQTEAGRYIIVFFVLKRAGKRLSSALATWTARNARPMAEDRTSSISQSRTLEEMAEFWDTHSLADYDDQTYEVEMTFAPSARRSLVAIDPELMRDLRRIARKRQVSTQTLVNVWLRQRADQVGSDTVHAG